MATMLKLPIIKLKLHFKESFPHILTVIILLCAFMYSSIERLYRYFCYWHDHRYKSIFSIHFSFANDANIAYIFLLLIIQLHSFWCMQQKSYETFVLDKLIWNRSTTLDESRQTMKKNRTWMRIWLEWCNSANHQERTRESCKWRIFDLKFLHILN